MPPFLPRKRRSRSPPTSTQKPLTKKARLADALDTDATNNVSGFAKTRTFSLGSDSSSDSSLSEVDSDQFEDVPVTSKASGRSGVSNIDENDGDDDDDVEWEDAAAATVVREARDEPLANGPIQLTFRKDEEPEYTTVASGTKKGPSRREKQARIHAHQMHVQFLLWHNAVRNKWIEDSAIQKLLVTQLPTQITKEVDRWKRASGLLPPEPQSHHVPQRGKKGRKSKAKNDRNQRDWGQPSSRLEAGKPDMSHGDPIIPLMKILSAYWKKRFAITAPGLRKKGYGTKLGLKREIQSWRQDEHDPERHGERISGIADFKKIAEKCEGSRDVGAQLFTALLRGLGIEARMVASLQPTGFGWTKAEQLLPKKDPETSKTSGRLSDAEQSTSRPSSKVKTPKSGRKSRTKPSVIDLDTDAENDEMTPSVDDDGGDSVVDVTPSMPVQRKAKYDRDLAFPIYWTEAISPITSKVLPVSPLVLENSVASTPEFLAAFEPRGAKAEKNKQVMAYVVAYSTDGTAKDVTVRYLRKRMWPGKTKGFRFPVEKVPLYDKRGKIKRYEDYDWAKHVISLWGRSTHKRRPVDDVEDATDLRPAASEKKGDGGVDTLQSLKASAEFVLERFLRREEALRPGASPTRVFVSGKGDQQKEEPVYRRADVERCLTAESWHKEGRRPQLGEHPMKLVPVRAVTLTRKREAEEHERVTGEKQMQGLYSWDQTEWIIPAPIQDGIIPKNAYGNMDCFVPSMVPRGAIHIPLKGTVRICKKLEIDYAEAVTGFEFGNKRAVPVCTGVVVAAENEKIVKDAWQAWNEEQRQKQETKMEKLVLDLWKKFVVGLRIRERIAEEYGQELGIVDTPTGLDFTDPIDIDNDGDQTSKTDGMGGGFVEEDEEFGGGFLLPHEDDASEREELVMDKHDESDSKKGWNAAAQTKTSSSTSTNQNQRPETSLPTSDEESDDHVDEESEDEPMDFRPLRNNQKQLQSQDPAQDRGHASRYEREQMLSRELSFSVSAVEDEKAESESGEEIRGGDQTDAADNGEDAEEAGEEEVYVPRNTRRPRRTTKLSSAARSMSDTNQESPSSNGTKLSATPQSNSRARSTHKSTSIQVPTKATVRRALLKSKQEKKKGIDSRMQRRDVNKDTGNEMLMDDDNGEDSEIDNEDKYNKDNESDTDSGVDVTTYTSNVSKARRSRPKSTPSRRPNRPNQKRPTNINSITSAKKVKGEEKTEKKTKVKQEDEHDKSGSSLCTPSSVSARTKAETPQSRSRSARLMKRENSRVTSPYF